MNKHKINKIMKKLLFVSTFAFCGISLFAIENQTPQNQNFEKSEDNTLSEQDVINAINWLSATPIDQDVEKRKDVYAVLLVWMINSTDVKIVVGQEVVNFLPNPDLLMAFMGGWTKYSLETRDFSSLLKNNIAGIENVILVYNKNKKTLGRNKNIEKYIKHQSKGTLEKEIKKRLNKQLN